MSDLDPVYQELAQRAVIPEIAPAGSILVKVDSPGRLYEAKDAGEVAGQVVTGIAGEVLSGHRVVKRDYTTGELFYADKDNSGDANSILGLTLQAANIGDQCRVRIVGELIEPSWSFVNKRPVFLGNNGQLTQTKPTTGFIVRIGIPQGLTRLLVNIEEPIILYGG
jgi:hypothetical protein